MVLGGCRSFHVLVTTFSSAVMALYWDPVPSILIGKFMKNNAMSAHGKD